jgi:hypothetical protein
MVIAYARSAAMWRALTGYHNAGHRYNPSVSISLGSYQRIPAINTWRSERSDPNHHLNHSSTTQPITFFQKWPIIRVLEKGKPAERLGRKATGLNPALQDMAAGLPGEYSISCILNLAWFKIAGEVL